MKWQACSRGRAVLLSIMRSIKCGGVETVELCRATTAQLQLCSSPSLESTRAAVRQNHAVGPRDGRRSVYPSSNVVGAVGRACSPPSCSFQLQKRRAAFGCSLWVLGSCVVSVHWINGEDAMEGGRLLSQHQGFWVFVLLVSKIGPDCKAKSFYSSCRNLQSLAHSLVCHFVLYHALF